MNHGQYYTHIIVDVHNYAYVGHELKGHNYVGIGACITDSNQMHNFCYNNDNGTNWFTPLHMRTG